MASSTLCIGLLAYTQLQHRTLRFLIEEFGYQVGTCLLISDLKNQLSNSANSGALVEQKTQADKLSQTKNEENSPRIDAWVIDVDTNAEIDDHDSDHLDAWLDTLDAPVLFCDGEIPVAHEEAYRAWSRRLMDKLKQLSGTINLEQSRDGIAQRVWVLAASTGGPAVVKQFLSELPPRLDIGFVYVQHIDKGFDGTLAQVMSKHTNYPAHIVEHGDVIRANHVAIVPADKNTEIAANGTFVVGEEGWATRYNPSVDSIVADVAHCYGERAGVIIFTGMGDDGAASCRMMSRKGGKVWVQTPSSCTSDSMPESALATGSVEFKGSPYSLAQQLVKEIQNIRYSRAATGS
ncbi:hypothetical protein NBRC116493_00760 [Aurantivibrio infirmus]